MRREILEDAEEINELYKAVNAGLQLNDTVQEGPVTPS